MSGIIRFVKNIFLLNKRLSEEEALQKLAGYSIVSSQEGPERYVTYSEGDRKVLIAATYSYLNDVTLHKSSFRKWDIPSGQELTPFDYERVLNRLVQYFSCWGDVRLSDAMPREYDLRSSLRQEGISFDELEDGVIRYTSTVEKESERKQLEPE